MLPGFRFLFAAIMLSMSLLIFGLGAAALLRAAHEQFASNSSWRAAPEVPFAQRPDTVLPVLAALRVEPSATEKANDPVTIDIRTAQQEPVAAEPVKTDQVAALKSDEALLDKALPAKELLAKEWPAETTAASAPAMSMQLKENPLVAETPSSEAAPVATPTIAADERKMTVAASDTSPIKNEPAALRAEPVIPPTDLTTTSLATPAAPVTAPADSPAATKIATLGGPPVDILDDTPPLEIRMVKLPRARPDQGAKPDQDLVRKRVQARRAEHRRRLALRARLLLQQQQPSGFGQPQPLQPATSAR
jgi:hypothetical protein